MATDRFNLAIETSARQGSIVLGRGDDLLARADLSQHQRHNVELMPAIDQLCQQHRCRPVDLSEIYVSVGPGSFTGLRIAIATTKALALALNIKVVAVPTLDVLAQQTPAPAESTTASGDTELSPPSHAKSAAEARLAICLNLKRAAAWTGLYRWADQRWTRDGESRLMTAEQIDALSPAATAILGDPLPDALADDVRRIDVAYAQPDARSTWAVGRRMAQADQYVDAAMVGPLYVRPPEAVEIWDARYGKGQGPDGLTPSVTPAPQGSS